jgi:hypothetical protein
MTSHTICPYPGLRPFNEDESIFFKGREEHIEKIVSQLEEKKFVMLTGASGDGKSSIVYAGVIPNARAGFFKARFNSWQIADFRPERSPLKNMAISLADKLEYSDVEYVEKKLRFGFSSLIDLYKSSPYFLDQNSTLWNTSNDIEKKKLKRKAANLFLLVDQFEEFFTNTENYHNGKASSDSETVINLLLETAKIALAENLPIYIICTMRSDYIGQCASFRGLPEYIGYSQFFVPRLKRKEIHQVIEEPAILNGNRISTRLIETLINEVGEGFDQLPVLQHALNSLWHIADDGNEEMDLVHLAMIAGLSPAVLSNKDRDKYDQWLATRPEFYKNYYLDCSLEQSLSANVNILFETAHTYYNKTHEQNISKEDAQLIIKTAFQSLTKIDDSRAVRNRVSLQEITNIINKPNITSDIVAGVMNIYREYGNFLKPFRTDNPSTHVLKNETVLDITHESLIRNWDLLKEWVNEENENRSNYLDFNKQMERWISGKKKRSYLLPKGPLAFFEQWYKSAKINASWLLKYDQRELDKATKIKEANEKIDDVNKFLGRSRRVFTIAKWITAASITWGVFWLCFMWYKASNSAETEKSKVEKLKTVMKFDQLNAKVIAPSSYVMSGDEYSADIIIAASSSNLGKMNANILIGDIDSLGNISNVTDTISIADGYGTFRKKAERPGLYEYQGVIQIKSPDGRLQNYPFASEYMVTAPSLVVNADAMNVMYMGVNNPMSVSVSGVAPNNLLVSATSGKVMMEKDHPGHYSMQFSAEGETTVRVGVVRKGGGVNPIGEIKFRVKKLPDPHAFVGQWSGSNSLTKAELAKQKGITAQMVGFDYSVKTVINSYSVIIISGNAGKQVNIVGANFTPEVLRLIQACRKGDKVIMDDIKVHMSDGTDRTISPISFEITG